MHTLLETSKYNVSCVHGVDLRDSTLCALHSPASFCAPLQPLSDTADELYEVDVFSGYVQQMTS